MSYATQNRPTTAPSYTYNNSYTSYRRYNNNNTQRFKSTQKQQQQKICNLDSIDDNDTYMAFNTPRSIEACRRLGIDPNTELTYKPINYFIDKYMTQSELLNKHIPDYAKLRYEHYNNRRQQKLNKLRQLRSNIQVNHNNNNSNKIQFIDNNHNNNNDNDNDILNKTVPLPSHNNSITAIENEKKSVLRMHKREMSKIKNKVMYELRIATIKSSQEYAIEQQRIKDEQYRIEQEKLQRQRNENELQQRIQHQKQLEYDEEQKRIQLHNEWLMKQQQIDESIQQQKLQHKQHIIEQQEAAKKALERKKQLEDRLEYQRLQIEHKKQLLEQREQQRLQSLEQKRIHDQTVAQQAYNKKVARYAKQIENNEMIEQHKRDIIAERDRLYNERQQLLEQQKQQQTAEMKYRARMKEEHAMRCRLEAERVLEAKRNAVLEKHAMIRDRLDNEEYQRQQNHHNVEAELQHKEDHRRNVYEQNQKLLEQRINDINQRIHNANVRHQQQLDERDHMLAQRKLHNIILNDERNEKLQESMRQHEYKRDMLLQRVQQDTERVQQIKQTKAQLQKERQRIRDDAYRKTEKIVNTFEQLAHAGKWDVLKSTDASENILLRSGIVTRDEIMEATSPKSNTSRNLPSRPKTASVVG